MYDTPGVKEGVSAFVGKRKPNMLDLWNCYQFMYLLLALSIYYDILYLNIYNLHKSLNHFAYLSTGSIPSLYKAAT